MGTRADFYVGRGESAEWIGSIAWDGYPSGGYPETVITATTEEDFRTKVKEMAAPLDHFTTPEMGWPWPWVTSHTTDYSYAFEDGVVWISCFGRSWKSPTDALVEDAWEDEFGDEKPTVFPDMTDRQKATFGHRSGLIVFGA